MSDFKTAILALEQQLKDFIKAYKKQQDKIAKGSNARKIAPAIVQLYKKLQVDKPAILMAVSTKEEENPQEIISELKKKAEAYLSVGASLLAGAKNASELDKIQDEVLTKFGIIFNDEVPKLEATAQKEVTDYTKGKQDEFEKAWNNRGLELLNEKADAILAEGLKALGGNLNATEMDQLFDEILTKFGEIFNDDAPKLESNEASKVETYTKGKQDEFEVAFEAKKEGHANSEVAALKKKADAVLAIGLTLIKGELSQAEMDKAFDEVLTKFGEIFNDDAPKLAETVQSEIVDYTKAKQDEFEAAFEAKKMGNAQALASELKKKADAYLAVGNSLLSGVKDASELGGIQDEVLTKFGNIFNDEIPKLEESIQKEVEDYTKGKQDEFETAWKNKGLELLNKKAENILAEGVKALGGNLNAEGMEQLFDKILTKFGTIFNEDIPTLDESIQKEAEDYTKGKQDEFEVAFEAKKQAISKDQADELKEKADGTLSIGLSLLQGNLDQAAKDKLEDEILTKFGTIFNEDIPKLEESIQKEVEDYTKGKQDEFEAALEAKKQATAQAAADSLKQKADAYLAVGNSLLSGAKEASELAKIQDEVLTKFGIIFNDEIPKLEEAAQAEVEEYTKAKQDEFEAAWNEKGIDLLNQKATAILAEGIQALSTNLSATEMEELFDKILTKFGHIFNEDAKTLAPEQAAKVEDYTRGKQDEFEAAFEAKQKANAQAEGDALKKEVDTILNVGLLLLQGELDAAAMDKAFDEVLTKFGTIFNDEIPQLAESVQGEVEEYTRGKQDEFEAAFEEKKKANAQAEREELMKKADAYLAVGNSLLGSVKTNEALAGIQDEILTKFGTLFNDEIPKLEASVQAELEEYVKAKQDEFETLWKEKGIEVLNKKADDILSDGLRGLNGNLTPVEMEELFDEILTKFGEIFNEDIKDLEAEQATPIETYARGKQDAFEKAFEEKKQANAQAQADDLKQKVDGILNIGLSLLQGEMGQVEMDELFDDILTRFGTVFNDEISTLEESVQKEVEDYTRGKQDEFEAAFEEKKQRNNAAQVGQLKEKADAYLAVGNSLLSAAKEVSELDKIQDDILTRFGIIYNDEVPKLEEATQNEINDYTRAKQDEFEASFNAKRVELLYQEANNILAEGRKELSGALDAAQMEQLFDDILTKFGVIFNEELPKLDDKSSKKVDEHTRKAQDEFEAAFKAKQDANAEAETTELKKKADAYLSVGQAVLSGEVDMAKLMEVQDDVLTKFGVIFNEEAPKLSEAGQEIIFEYTKAKQDEFEKAWEAKKKSIEADFIKALKKKADNYVSVGAEMLENASSEEEIAKFEDDVLTKFGIIYNEEVPKLSEDKQKEVNEYTRAKQDEFEAVLKEKRAEVTSL